MVSVQEHPTPKIQNFGERRNTSEKRKARRLEVTNYVADHHQAYKEELPFLLKDWIFSTEGYLSAIFLGIFGICLGYFKTRALSVPFFYAIPVMIHVFYPVVSKTKFDRYFLRYVKLLAVLYILSWTATFGYYISNGLQEHLTYSVLPLYVLIIWIFSISSTRTKSIFFGGIFSILFICGLTAISSAIVFANLPSILLGLVLGVVFNILISFHLQNRFYGETKNARDARVRNVMRQGVLILSTDKKIPKSYGRWTIALNEKPSMFTMDLLGAIEGIKLPSLENYLLRKSTLNTAEIENILTLLTDVLEGTVQAFEQVKSFLPSRVEIQRGEVKKTIELVWQPLLRRSGERMEHIVLSIFDVTIESSVSIIAKQLGSANEKLDSYRDQLFWAKDSLKMLSELIHVGREDSIRIMNVVRENSFEALNSIRISSSEQSLQNVFRHVHNIKPHVSGKFTLIFNSIASLEEILVCLLATSSSGRSITDIINDLESLSDTLNKYTQLMSEPLHWRLDVQNEIVLPKRDFMLLMEKSNLLSDALSGKMLSESINEGTNICYPKLKHLVEQCLHRCFNVAASLGKEVPYLHVFGDDVIFEESVSSILQSAFTHMLNNSLDHGIESSAIRLSLGKNKRGTIMFEAKINETFVKITWSDDGGGIDRTRVASVAIEKGLRLSGIQSDAESDVNLIFDSGFSTKQEISSISGRGVGMDSVKTSLRKIGGDAKIKLRERISESSRGMNFSDIYAFEIELYVPIKSVKWPTTSSV